MATQVTARVGGFGVAASISAGATRIRTGTVG